MSSAHLPRLEIQHVDLTVDGNTVSGTVDVYDGSDEGRSLVVTAIIDVVGVSGSGHYVTGVAELSGVPADLTALTAEIEREVMRTWEREQDELRACAE